MGRIGSEPRTFAIRAAMFGPRRVLLVMDSIEVGFANNLSDWEANHPSEKCVQDLLYQLAGWIRYLR